VGIYGILGKIVGKYIYNFGGVMTITVDDIVRSFVVGVIVGFVGSVLGGLFFVTPHQIASKLSLVFPAAGAITGSSNGKNLEERTVYATVGGLGAILGWVIYRGIVL